MASNRIGRINEEIQRELAQQLRLLKDPRVQKTMVSITHVETTPDLRYAKVYVSLLDRSCTKEVLAGLKSSGGFLRRALEQLPTDGRPLSQTNPLDAMFAKRAPMYAAFADHAVSNDGTAEETVAAILSIMEEPI